MERRAKVNRRTQPHAFRMRLGCSDIDLHWGASVNRVRAIQTSVLLSSQRQTPLIHLIFIPSVLTGYALRMCAEAQIVVPLSLKQGCLLGKHL